MIENLPANLFRHMPLHKGCVFGGSKELLGLDDEEAKEGLQDFRKLLKNNLEGTKNLHGLCLDLGSERLGYFLNI